MGPPTRGGDDPQGLSASWAVVAAERDPPAAGRPAEVTAPLPAAVATGGQPPRISSGSGRDVERHAAAVVRPGLWASEKRKLTAVLRPGRPDDGTAVSQAGTARDRAQARTVRIDDQEGSVLALENDLPVASEEQVRRRRDAAQQQQEQRHRDRQAETGATTAQEPQLAPPACPRDNVVPVGARPVIGRDKLVERGGKLRYEVGTAHVIASSYAVRRFACAACKVAETVPVSIPSAAAICR